MTPEVNCDLERTIYIDKVGLMFRGLRVGIAASSVAAVFFVFVMSSIVSWEPLLTWLGALLVVSIVFWMVGSWLARLPADLRNAHRRERINAVLLVFLGSAWGSAGIFFLLPEEPLHVAFVTVVLLGVVSPTVGSLSTSPVSYIAFAITVIAPLVFHFLLLGSVVYSSLAILVGLYLALHLYFCRLMNWTVTQSLRLRHENVSLVDELRRQKAFAEQARGRAEQANLAKSRFLAAASHDLRQPVHAQGLLVDALDGSPDLSARSRELVTNIKRSTSSLEDLFNALLEISKLDARAVESRLVDFRLDSLLTEIRIQSLALAEERGLQLRVVNSSAVVRCDRVHLKRMLQNLVSNAVLHTSSGRVLVGCRRRPDVIRIAVHDTGPGILDAELGHIFSEFYQIENPERDRTKGLGLGLAIVSRLADLVGVRVGVASAPGRGSTFWLDVPRGNVSRVQEDSGRSRRPVSQLDGVCVLVIDDERDVRTAMESMLVVWGCTVLTADSAETAVRRLAKLRQKPGLIIADYRLRGHATGIDAVESVHAALGHEVPTIMITGDTAPSRVRELTRSDWAVLHKPVKSRVLHEIITSTLAGHSI